MMTQTTQSLTLTPVQFQVARALARAFSHLWSSVPDGTYNVADIEAYSDSISHPSDIGGISGPTLVSLGGELSDHYQVVHTTYSGRLTWKITDWGNVQLIVTRPDDIEVANVWLLNNEETLNIQDMEFSFSVGNPALAMELKATYDERIHEDLLFIRHVDALVRPIVAVITAHKQDAYEKDHASGNQEDHEQFQNSVIEPAIVQAKEWLAPLYTLALPDPYFDGAIGFEEIEQWCRGEIHFGSLREEQPEKYPVPLSFWTRSQEYGGAPIVYGVFHMKKGFPVESEKVAVHSTLLLIQHPTMQLTEAVRRATLS